jgi:hypothetical protein
MTIFRRILRLWTRHFVCSLFLLLSPRTPSPIALCRLFRSVTSTQNKSFQFWFVNSGLLHRSHHLRFRLVLASSVHFRATFLRCLDFNIFVVYFSLGSFAFNLLSISRHDFHGFALISLSVRFLRNSSLSLIIWAHPSLNNFTFVCLLVTCFVSPSLVLPAQFPLWSPPPPPPHPNVFVRLVTPSSTVFPKVIHRPRIRPWVEQQKRHYWQKVLNGNRDLCAHHPPRPVTIFLSPIPLLLVCRALVEF